MERAKCGYDGQQQTRARTDENIGNKGREDKRRGRTRTLRLFGQVDFLGTGKWGHG